MIAAVVVTFSAPAGVLDRCVRAIRQAGGVDRLIVIDTGGTAELAPDVGDAVELVRMENRGYGAAANRGFARARDLGATAIALLNDDVVVGDGWLPSLVTALEGDRVGAAQPVLMDAEVVASRGVRIDRYGAGVDIGDGEPGTVGGSQSDLEIFTGGAVVFPVDFLDAVGGFDERYFLYYEDVDLALRGRELGWTYRLVPDSTVEHRRGTSTGQHAARTRYHQERNRLWIAFRFGDPATIGRAVWLSVRRLRHEPRAVHRRALVAGLAGTPGAVWRRVRAPGRRTAHR